MKMVVGIDGSAPSTYALEWAIARAAQQHASLQVVHAWHLPATVAPDAWTVYATPADCELAAKHVMEETVGAAIARVHAEPDALSTSVVRGDSATAIVSAASDADQIVVGTHGHGFFGRALLGSVAELVLHESPIPVTVVPHLQDPQPNDKPVVVGLDDSPSSDRALAFALDVATARAVALKVVHAYPIVGEVPREVMRDAAEEMVLRKLSAAARERTAMPDYDTVIVSGQASARLVRAAKDAGDLVVGYSGAAEHPWLFGSVSRRCVHESPCAVTVVK